jgi:hypothetical protein
MSQYHVNLSTIVIAKVTIKHAIANTEEALQVYNISS